jgi:hypothetical protein
MKEAMKQIIAEIDALPEGLEGYFSDAFADNLAKVRKALAQPEQEPVAWKWHQAPVKTSWGHDMVVADLAIDKDNTVSVYCERDQTTKVEAMFSTPPQRTEQEQQIETLKRCLFQMQEAAKSLTSPQRTEPICPECKAEVLYECVACSCNNYPPKENT